MHVPDKSADAAGPNRLLLDAAAGALAGCVSRFVVGPLDVVKIRFQVQLEPIARSSSHHAAQHLTSKYTSFGQALATIFKEEGVPGLWRGTVPGLLLTVPYTAVQFVALQQFRQYAAKLGWSDRRQRLMSFTSGAFAGTAATIASYPFDLLRTTLAAQGEPKVYHGMLDAAKSIYKERGVRGLYSGLGVTLVEIIPYAALQFGLYDMFKDMWSKARRKAHHEEHGSSGLPDSETKLQHFACGLLAGLVAKLTTHPLDVAKKRYQVAGLRRSLKYGARIDANLGVQSLGQCLVEIYRAEGVRGLWKGSVPSIVKAAPAAAITFTAYEAIIAWLLAAAAHRSAAENAAVRQL